MTKYTDCKACNGTDEILDRTTGDYITCPSCNGSGFQEIPSDDITVFTDVTTKGD